ncbi:hypothetical protein K402DRAFT_368059 [Aulographum hederae CBS 113979]|uniref:Uncharacterized protein n=1 Tax=Aulographum hederae CBS 113979 TaxID=1176131 RepID=A0A6G1HEI4_9PEZI|nr:hypothetical protein K402DRAFT_368059 [Aulographum hederae CBS 113979]
MFRMEFSTPRTPERPLDHRPVDSPFSDYYTEPAFSPDPFTSSGPLQKNLIHRLSTIAGQIVRNQPDEQFAAFLNAKLDNLESILAAPDSQSRKPEIDDSGLFLGDDETGEGLGIETTIENDVDDHHGREYGHSDVSDTTDSSHDISAQEMQAMVERVAAVSQQLRLRYEEVKHLNDLAIVRIESSTAENLRLRSENDSLRSDISFDHSELLFLKLQLRAIEAQAEAVLDRSTDASLMESIERWKLDYKDVDKRFKARRISYKSDSVEEVNRPASPGTKVYERRGKNGEIEYVTTRKILTITRPASKGKPFIVRTPTKLEGEIRDITAPKYDTKASMNTFDEHALEDESVADKQVIIKVEEKTPWQELVDGINDFIGMNMVDTDDEN